MEIQIKPIYILFISETQCFIESQATQSLQTLLPFFEGGITKNKKKKKKIEKKTKE